MNKQFIFLIFTTIYCFSCKRSNNQEQPITAIVETDSLAVINDPRNSLNVQMKSFVEVDSSGILLFPLTMGESQRNSESSVYKSAATNDCWNIVFYNTKTKVYHLLSDQKMLILRYYNKYQNEEVENSKKEKYIFYSIIVDDYDNDKELTYLDPGYLFVTDKEGNNLRQISPKGYHLHNWAYIKSSEKIIMTVIKDSDNNKKFDDPDEISSFEIDFDKETSSNEMFNTEFKNKLKLLYEKDWKKIK